MKKRILIDMGHPEDVHDFKNFYFILKEKGYEFLISARNRDVIFSLLDAYNIPYFSRGKGSSNRFGKFIYMFFADLRIFFKCLRFRPDIFISHNSPYAAQVSFLMRKPNIVLTDTEHSIKAHTYLTNPFSDVFLTPVVYYNDLGEKQIRFNNIMESLYLHEDFFKPSISVYEYLKIEPETNYVILRFVAWNAFHDVNQKGIDLQTKLQLIKLLEPHYKIFISNEGKIEKELENYELVIPPHMMHDVLNFANLFIGESGTMASECAYLGTPTVYVNSLPLMGYLELEEKHGLLRHFNNTDGLISYVKEQLKNKDNIKKISLNKSGVFKKNFINTTRFLVWFIENYPASFDIMKKNPDYQNEFK